MIIQREQGFDKIKFSLRYRFEEETKAQLFCKSMQENQYQHKLNQAKNGLFIVLIDIEENNLDANVLQNIHTELKIEDNDFDFFVKFTTEYDHAGIDFPKNVLDLHKNLGGGIAISIICLS